MLELLWLATAQPTEILVLSDPIISQVTSYKPPKKDPPEKSTGVGGTR